MVHDTTDGVTLPRGGPGLLAFIRVAVAILWIQNAGWKSPGDDFGRTARRGLYLFTSHAVDYPVFPPFTWFVEHVVLPNFTFFGWLTLLVESSLGAFLLAGLATRLWALIGIAQTLAITFSVLKAPHEWHWTYFLMVLIHLALFATAAGRFYGADGLLRPSWERSANPLARLLVRFS
jgi:thiosulfate dehydrogenase [quinone] large subunit